MRRRHDPDRRSRRPVRSEDEDLPQLEAIAGELEQVLSPGAVAVSCAAATEPGFDVAVEISVPAMDKHAMADAVGPALRRALAPAQALVRNRRVAVRICGDVVVGSAVRDAVRTVLEGARARRIVLRRGYGDEVLLDAPPPQVRIDRRTSTDTVFVDVDTGELEAADLPAAMQHELAALAGAARGLRLVFAFTGAARPDAAMRELLRRTLVDAGAARAAIGDRVLFDHELEARVRITARGDEVDVEFAPADDENDTLDAIAMVLGKAGDRLTGRDVQLHFPRPPRARELDAAVEQCQQAAPRRLTVATGDDVDVVLPRLLEVAPGDAAVLVRVRVGGRLRPAVEVAFARECAELGADVEGRIVQFDWPADPAIDHALEDLCLRRAQEQLRPKALWCSSGGGEPEPYWPAPFALGTDAAVRTLRVDVDAGRPSQVLAAVQRRLPAALAVWRGASARLQFAGAASPSRTLLRALIEIIGAAGVQRLEVDDRGAIDVVLPPLLQVAGHGTGVRLAATAAGRDLAQVETALQRELAGVTWQDLVVTVAESTLVDRLVRAAVERGAVRVVLEGTEPIQLHPCLLATERTAGRLVVRATPGADPAMTARQLARELPRLLDELGDLRAATVAVEWPDQGPVPTGFAAEIVAGVLARAPARVLFTGGRRLRQLHPRVTREHVAVLGRKDDAVPPLLMLGIDVGGDEVDHDDRVLDRLRAQASAIAGRRVLLVARDGSQDLAVRDDSPLFLAVRAAVDNAASATLLFRGADAHGRPYFTVAHSNEPALPRGAAFADPRARRRPVDRPPA